MSENDRISFEEFARKVVAENPESAYDLWNAGGELLARGGYESALVCLTSAVREAEHQNLPPSIQGQIRISLGTALTQASKYDEAERCLRDAAKRAEEEGASNLTRMSAYDALRVLFIRTGRGEEAATYSAKTLELLARRKPPVPCPVPDLTELLKKAAKMPPLALLPPDELIRAERPESERTERLQHTGSVMSVGELDLKPAGPNAWTLEFKDDAAKQVQRRIAAECWGDADRSFTLTLRRDPAADPTGPATATLNVTPVPLKKPLELGIVFATGDPRDFFIDLPPEVKNPRPGRDPRTETGSLKCKPLPAEAFAFTGGEWSDDAWPPRLTLR